MGSPSTERLIQQQPPNADLNRTVIGHVHQCAGGPGARFDHCPCIDETESIGSAFGYRSSSGKLPCPRVVYQRCTGCTGYSTERSLAKQTIGRLNHIAPVIKNTAFTEVHRTCITKAAGRTGLNYRPARPDHIPGRPLEGIRYVKCAAAIQHPSINMQVLNVCRAIESQMRGSIRNTQIQQAAAINNFQSPSSKINRG